MTETLPYSAVCISAGRESLGFAIGSALSQTVLPTEIIVAIDGRWNNEVPKVVYQMEQVAKSLGIRYDVQVFQPESFAQLKNYAFNSANNQWLLYVEDDIWLPPNYAEKLLGEVDNKVGAIGGCQMLVEDYQDIDEKPIFQQIDLPKEKLYQRLTIKDGEMDYDGMRHQLYWYKQDKVVPAMCLIHTYLLNKVALEDVNGFDQEADDSTSLWAEESDLTLRMFLGGYQVLIDTGLVMWHLRNGYHNRVINSKAKYNEKKRQQERSKRKRYFAEKFEGEI